MERFFLNDGPMPDVYIKDEGYAAVKFLSVAAKKLAYRCSIENALLQLGPKFCDHDCFDPKLMNFDNSIYECGVTVSESKKISKYFRERGLTVDSDYE